MSFEDLQKKWIGQFPTGSSAPNAQREAELLEQIQRRERGFRRLVILGIARDVLLFSAAIGTAALATRHGFPIPKDITRKYRPFAVAAGGGAILLTILTIKGRLWLTPSAAQSASVLPDRVQRDRGRFDALVLWSDFREVLSAAVVIVFAVFQALTLPAHQYAGLSWAGAGLFALSIVLYMTYRHRSKALRPAWDGSMLGVLKLSIHQTRRRVQLLENLWWYIAPLYLGLLLVAPVRLMLVHGRIGRPELVGLAVSAAVVGGAWGLNLWVARHRLRPRLEQLEKLQSELSPSS